MRNERSESLDLGFHSSLLSASASHRDFQNLDFYAHDVQTANARDNIIFLGNRRNTAELFISNAVKAKNH